MRVVVIGANGQLGSDLCEVLQGKLDVVPLTHKEIEVTDIDSVELIADYKPDVVINTAAFVRVDDAEFNVEEAFRVNAQGALNVSMICNKINAINIYISTNYVFDGGKGEPYVESDTPNPINIYGLSKYAGELITINYSLQPYVVRIANIYGRGGSKGNLVDIMIQKALIGEQLKVVDDAFISPTHTKDVATTLGEFLEVAPEYGVYHMVNEGYCNLYEFVEQIFNILGWDIQMEPIKSTDLNRTARRPIFSSLKNKGLEGLGLKMKDWREALEEYLKMKGYQV